MGNLAHRNFNNSKAISKFHCLPELSVMFLVTFFFSGARSQDGPVEIPLLLPSPLSRIMKQKGVRSFPSLHLSGIYNSCFAEAEGPIAYKAESGA